VWPRSQGAASGRRPLCRMHSVIDACHQRRGFVWCQWTVGTEGHLTLFYFDIAARRQVFFDPSHWTHRVGTQLKTPFGTTHFWDTGDGVTCEVVDGATFGQRGVNVQALFEPQSALTDTRYRGSCASVCLIVLVCCLRFGCTDLQRMCNAVRNAISQRKYTDDNFLMSVYRWHERLAGSSGIPSPGDDRRRLLAASHPPAAAHTPGGPGASGTTSQTVPGRERLPSRDRERSWLR
jgi:hypothetical protein